MMPCWLCSVDAFLLICLWRAETNYSFQKSSLVTTVSQPSLSSSHHAFSPPKETHLLLDIHLLITICFSWFAFVPQFRLFQHCKSFDYKFKWSSSINHKGVASVETLLIFWQATAEGNFESGVFFKVVHLAGVRWLPTLRHRKKTYKENPNQAFKGFSMVIC